MTAFPAGAFPILGWPDSAWSDRSWPKYGTAVVQAWGYAVPFWLRRRWQVSGTPIASLEVDHALEAKGSAVMNLSSVFKGVGTSVIKFSSKGFLGAVTYRLKSQGAAMGIPLTQLHVKVKAEGAAIMKVTKRLIGEGRRNIQILLELLEDEE